MLGILMKYLGNHLNQEKDPKRNRYAVHLRSLHLINNKNDLHTLHVQLFLAILAGNENVILIFMFQPTNEQFSFFILILFFILMHHLSRFHQLRVKYTRPSRHTRCWFQVTF